jgi:DNA sulfur modification protein DndD
VTRSQAIDDFRIISNELRERGELPSGIKQQFVKDLLQQENCICGTQLLQGSLPYSLVEKWMDKAGIGDIEEIVIRMGAEVESIDKEVPVIWQDIDREKHHQEQLKSKESDIETQILDIHERLKNSPLEDIRALENRYEQIKKDIEKLFLEKGENKANIEKYEREVDLKNTLLLRQQANEVKQKIALQRIKVTQEAIKMLSRIREIKNKRFRSELERSVQDIFGQISFKPYSPKLNDNYELTLIENTSGVQQNVPASSGENVILSLSFISSIISKVREWSRQNDAINLGSGIFPIVMDSPFSKLDTEYKKRIATAIPQLADQLVLITNKAHWVNEVEQEMNEYIGKHYVLTYFSPKPDYNDDSNISLYDRSYPLVKRSPNDWEYTEIIEVSQYN